MSCLLMGLGHPVLLPGGWTRLGLFPGSPLSPRSRLGLARLPGHSALGPIAWLAGAWDSAPGAPGAADPWLWSTYRAVGKEAHLGLRRRLFWGDRKNHLLGGGCCHGNAHAPLCCSGKGPQHLPLALF